MRAMDGLPALQRKLRRAAESGPEPGSALERMNRMFHPFDVEQ
jgi:hypothetical protein